LGLLAAGFVVVGFITILLLKNRISGLLAKHDQIEIYFQRVSYFFSFQWLVPVFSWFHGLVGMVPGFISGVLEGEGGILWAILLLALLISLLRSGGG
jgi:hypothetical protein